MRKIILLLLMAVAVQSNFAQVGELKEVKKATTTKWKNHEKYYTVTEKGQTYALKEHEKPNEMAKTEIDIYRKSTDGKLTLLRTFKPDKTLYNYLIVDSFGKSSYIFYIDWSAKLFAYDIVTGNVKLLDDFKFNTQQYSSCRFNISDNRNTLLFTCVANNKVSTACFNDNLSTLYKYENIKLPGFLYSIGMDPEFIKLEDDGNAIVVFYQGTIGGFIADKNKVEAFESFIDYKKNYIPKDFIILKNNNKNYLVGTVKDRKSKKLVFVKSSEIGFGKLQSLTYKMTPLPDSIQAVYFDPKSKEGISLPISPSYNKIENGFLLFAKKMYYNGIKFSYFDACFIKLNMDMDITDIAVLYYRQEEGDEVMFDIDSNKIGMIYNDAKNHSANTPISDYADFTYISDRKKGARESAIYAAVYDIKSNTVKKQLLLESDDKSNLINRFYRNNATLGDNKITFDVIQGEFKKGAGEDNMDWKTYEFIFNK